MSSAKQVSDKVNKTPPTREEVLAQLLDANIRSVDAGVRWDRAKREIKAAYKEVIASAAELSRLRNSFAMVEYSVELDKDENYNSPSDIVDLDDVRLYKIPETFNSYGT